MSDQLTVLVTGSDGFIGRHLVPYLATHGYRVIAASRSAFAFAAARAAPGAVLFGPDYDLKIPALAADRFAVRSQIAMAIDVKADKPYLFGLHQCSRARVWTAEEQRLFQEIGRRLSDTISALSIFRSCL